MAPGKAFGGIFRHDVVYIDDPIAGLDFRWTIQDRWKLVWAKKTAPQNSALFDVIADPRETADLQNGNAAVVARLRASVNDWFPVP